MAKKTTKKASKKAAEKQETASAQTLGPWAMLFITLTVVAAVLVLLSLTSRGKDQCEYVYNQFCFDQTEDGLWTAHMDINGVPYSIAFHHYPSSLEAIPVQEGAAQLVRGLSNHIAAGGQGQLYIALNPDDPADMAIAAIEISKVTGDKNNIYNIPTRVAMIKASPNVAQDTPIITCKDAKQDQLVVWLKTKGENLVALAPENPYCIVLQATTANESIQVADRFVYELFGIMTG